VVEEVEFALGFGGRDLSRDSWFDKFRSVLATVDENSNGIFGDQWVKRVVRREGS
jgi:hypothetical protein